MVVSIKIGQFNCCEIYCEKCFAITSLINRLHFGTLKSLGTANLKEKLQYGWTSEAIGFDHLEFNFEREIAIWLNKWGDRIWPLEFSEKAYACEFERKKIRQLNYNRRKPEKL